MNSTLLFEFVADRSNNTLKVKREFAAQRQLVWDCHTKRELLDQWFAPKPLITKTKSMDFREGGHWHFAMVDQNGAQYWSYSEYVTIRPIDYYQTRDAFSDENGRVNSDLPQARWDVTFSDYSGHTLVSTVVTYPSLNDLETVLKMGMEAGLTSTLERLDELLKIL